jgi:paraquat-inducible protein B
LDPIKRKVLTELFLAPSVVLPIVGGISSGMLSWAAGGNGYLTLAGAVGFLGGIGWMLTRIIFQVESITEEAMRFEHEQREKADRLRLDELAGMLRKELDHRTQDYLTLLRSLRDDFQETADQPGIRNRSAKIREQVSLVFDAAVEQLRQSYSLWELSEDLRGDARTKVLANREQVIAEIGATVDRLQATVTQFKELVRRDNKVDLASMRDELEATMRVARRTEERMREEFENSSSQRSLTRE